MNEIKLKDLKKVLMVNVGYIRLGSHTKRRMNKRGYTKGDMVSGVMTGEIVEVQYGFNYELRKSCFTYVVEGKDTSGNPIVIVVSEEGRYKFLVVTVMPPTDRNRFIDCI
ncbi:DUF4258 domain-containing protein [Aquibacillus sp. 3ASR75-11]|uniref:DUF4258 domain-containing protein n=1 Tax=Terrihalobacillus insolitus TaxID=2950438 RepID=A0A9X3WUK4_9BACI|nr:DUF4258 domain-containing protein [Terrihalobacillus insolitus]MDC3424276.1 DUF4258 domain-containing protein [Terrihalobacillus insolitus]